MTVTWAIRTLPRVFQYYYYYYVTVHMNISRHTLCVTCSYLNTYLYCYHALLFNCANRGPILKKCAAFHSGIIMVGSSFAHAWRMGDDDDLVWYTCCARVINSATGTCFLSLQNELGDDLPWEEVSWDFIFVASAQEII